MNLIKMLWFLLLQIFKLCSAELITLSRGNNVSCIITEQDVHVPFYVQPPQPGVQISGDETNTLENAAWTSDGWQKESKEISSHSGAITDKRWQYFEEKWGNRTMHEGKSLSFSVYSPGDIKIFLRNDSNLGSKTYEYEQQLSRQWEHFIVFSKNNKVFILHGDIILKIIDDFLPQSIVVKSKTETAWRTHEHKGKWSDKPSTEAFSRVKLSPSKRTCVMLYVLLCKHCCLDVFVRGPSQTHEINVAPITDSLALAFAWQSRLITLEPTGETTIDLWRRTTENHNSGFWAFDLEACSNETEIYTLHLDNNNFTCEALSANATYSEKLSCEPGRLGGDCNISCEELVANKYCQHYKICRNLDCQCAWGSKGTSCNEICSNGTWGINCVNKCPLDCSTCDVSTGSCPKKSGTAISKFGIILSATIPLIMLILFLIGFFTFKRMSQSYPNQSVDNQHSEQENVYMLR